MKCSVIIYLVIKTLLLCWMSFLIWLSNASVTPLRIWLAYCCVFMASRFHIYSYFLISWNYLCCKAMVIIDINNSISWYQEIGINVKTACHKYAAIRNPNTQRWDWGITLHLDIAVNSLLIFHHQTTKYFVTFDQHEYVVVLSGPTTSSKCSFTMTSYPDQKVLANSGFNLTRKAKFDWEFSLLCYMCSTRFNTLRGLHAIVCEPHSVLSYNHTMLSDYTGYFLIKSFLGIFLQIVISDSFVQYWHQVKTLFKCYQQTAISL